MASGISNRMELHQNMECELSITQNTSAQPSIPLSGNGRQGVSYRSYTEENMAAAVLAVTKEGLSLRQASARHNVPKTTLAGRLGDQRPPMLLRKEGATKPPTTRYMWSEADMEKALVAIQEGTISSVAEAARQFGVPPSSLNARKRGRAPRNLKAELSRLSLEQEGLLADWAHAQAKLGLPPYKDDVFALAERVLQKQGVDRRLGKQWIQHWMRRHPNIEILDWKSPEHPETPQKAGGLGNPGNRADLDIL